MNAHAESNEHEKYFGRCRKVYIMKFGEVVKVFLSKHYSLFRSNNG